MIDVDATAQEIRKIGRSKGWEPISRMDWVCKPEKILAHLALIHSEINEAFDELSNPLYLGACNDGLAAEFADIQIRILDVVGGFTTDFGYYVRDVEGTFHSENELRAFMDLHTLVTDALEAARIGQLTQFLESMAELYCAVHNFAFGTFGIAMETAIAEKIEFNRTRPMKHGGKRI